MATTSSNVQSVYWDFWINISCWLHPCHIWEHRQLCPSLSLTHLAGEAAAWCARGCPRCLGFLPGCPSSPGVCVSASSQAGLASTDMSTVLKSHLHLLGKHSLQAKEGKFFSEQRSSLLRDAKLNSCWLWLTTTLAFPKWPRQNMKLQVKQSPKPGAAASPEGC